MEKIRIDGKSTEMLKVELNGAGDYIVISADNPLFFDSFVSGCRHIFSLVDAIPAKMDEIEGKYKGKEDFASIMDKTAEMSAVNVGFSTEAAKTIDGIFGDGTTRKYFREIYEEIPDFLPDADCIMDFFDQITPVMEGIFKRKVERQQEESRARMAKYQPQDHKKARGKGTAK